MMYAIVSMHNSHFCKSSMLLNDPVLILFWCACVFSCNAYSNHDNVLELPFLLSLSWGSIDRITSALWAMYYHQYNRKSRTKGMSEHVIRWSFFRWMGERIIYVYQIEILQWKNGSLLGCMQAASILYDVKCRMPRKWHSYDVKSISSIGINHHVVIVVRSL